MRKRNDARDSVRTLYASGKDASLACTPCLTMVITCSMFEESETNTALSLCVCMYVYMYVCTCAYVSVLTIVIDV